MKSLHTLTWLYKAWLWFLLMSSWLDASLTNHSNCAFLSDKVFITSRAKANRAAASIRGRFHGRYWLTTRTACVIWKTRINECLMKREEINDGKGRAGSEPCPHALTHVLCSRGPGWLLWVTCLLFSIFWPIVLTKEISAIIKHILRQNRTRFCITNISVTFLSSKPKLVCFDPWGSILSGHNRPYIFDGVGKWNVCQSSSGFFIWSLRGRWG